MTKQPKRLFRNSFLYAICAGLSLLPGCGGSSSPGKTPPPTNCSIQVNAFDPPAPGGNNWNTFQKYVLPNSAIRGVDLVVPWNSVETSQGQYSTGLAALDSSFSNYPGKTINLIFQPISYGNMNNPTGGVNVMTPSYVFTSAWATSLNPPSPPLDVVECPPFPGNGTDPTTGFPAVYEAPFQVAYQNFISAVLQHYAGTPNIGYMRFGLSSGNETYLFCAAELQALPAPNTLTTQLAENWISTMDAYEKSVLPSPPIQLMQSLNQLDIDPTYTTFPDFEAATAVSNGFGFGNNGLRSSDITSTTSGNACSGDWCAMFDKYAGQVPLELQTLTPTDPSGSDSTNTTGNLADLIPVAAAHHATILEILMPDLYLAFDPNYVPKYPADSAFAGAYQAALTAPCSQ